MDSQNSCFCCIEKTIKKRSKCCQKIDDIDFFRAYLISNNLTNNNNVSDKFIFTESLSKYDKQIFKCAIAMFKYKQRVKICGARFSYREQQFYSKLKKIYKKNVTIKDTD